MSDIIFVTQVVRVSPDNKGGMVGEYEHWFFLKRLLLSKEKCKEGRVSGEDGAMSSQRVRRRDNRHVRDEHRLAHRLHHVPARRNVAQVSKGDKYLIYLQGHTRRYQILDKYFWATTCLNKGEQF